MCHTFFFFNSSQVNHYSLYESFQHSSQADSPLSFDYGRSSQIHRLGLSCRCVSRTHHTHCGRYDQVTRSKFKYSAGYDTIFVLFSGETLLSHIMFFSKNMHRVDMESGEVIKVRNALYSYNKVISLEFPLSATAICPNKSLDSSLSVCGCV